MRTQLTLFLLLLLIVVIGSLSLCTGPAVKEEIIVFQIDNNSGMIIDSISSDNEVNIQEIEVKENTKKYKIMAAAGTTICVSLISAGVTLFIHFYNQ